MLARPAASAVKCSSAVAALLVLAASSLSIVVAASPPGDRPALRLRSVTLTAGEPAPDVPARLAAAPLTGGGAALVQFDSATTPSRRRALVESAGGTFGAYVPEHGALVLLPRGGEAALQRAPEVLLVAALAPAWKLAPELAGADGALAVQVSLHEWANASTVLEEIASAGGEVLDASRDRLPGSTVRVSVPDRGAVEALARLESVRWIEPSPDYRLLNDRSRWVVQTNQSGSFRLHDLGLRGDGYRMAGMDSGLDEAHCCFQNGKVASYRKFGGGDTIDGCPTGHGTHVFGTVGCDEPADTFDGVAPGVRFDVQDIQYSGGTGCTFGAVQPPSDLRTAFARAHRSGSRVHTNSWGGGGNSYSVDAFEIDDFMWDKQDFLILFAAGNSGGGANAGTVSNQASAKNAVTVGGSENAPRQDWLYGSSSKGPTQGGRRKPTVTAPATRPATGGASVTSADNDTGCGFKGLSGTSMATPAVAGAAVLVQQYFDEGFYPSGAANAADGFEPSAALMKAVLIAGADDMTGNDTHGPRPNNSQGWGRVNLDNALHFAGDAETLTVLDDRDTGSGFAATGEEHVFDVFIADPAQPLRVVLVWTDPPAAPGSVDALVNDLDLTVELSGGLLYAGNAGYASGWAQPSTTLDRVNNHEAVMIAAPRAGNATVRVTAFEINDTPGQPQDYALVLVGGASGEACTASAPPSLDGSLRVGKTGSAVRLSWDDLGADHGHVYRSADPTGFGVTPYADFAVDQDGAPGVQWDDTGGLGPASWFYTVSNANACHDETP